MDSTGHFGGSYVRGRFDGEERVLAAELVVPRKAGSAAANPPMTPGRTPG
ncbi:hypothetical protein OOK39_43330 [Streptomyces sp. NBC_00264]|nr:MULTISPECIES: hypothetical protein [unclassified Streptomyces]WSG48627.1 hypothetical protein OHA38_01715 [Streptomyces sp. NBC_01732]MCX4399276.1 hypothetical protein [Streptomyces sp. NBC_01767]MCX5165464.1 hypothetical protein [Streptomyces sp. NBC_00305]MCX5166118.1 hypothetical protein [Streptomyces sp. NBC_00305]MCX5216251.1 hypothetical protein [Streptomyces sp. NBC_00264]